MNTSSTSNSSDSSKSPIECLMKCIQSFQQVLMSPLKRSPKLEETIVYATPCPACDECYEYHYNSRNPSFYCQPCNTKRFRLEFDKWSTGNNKLDRLIQNSHIKSKNVFELLEWIPYSNLKDITRIAQGGFATDFSAVWADGPMQKFDLNKKQWSRSGVTKVVFKEFHNSKDSSFKFLEEVIHLNTYLRVGGNKPITRIYGISQDPKSKNFGIVMKCANLGSLRHVLNENFHEKSWNDRFDIILEISSCISKLHDGLVFDIFMGQRPQLPKETPQQIKKLLSKCLDANPEGRPTMQQIHKKLDGWKSKIRNNPSSKIYKEFQLANEDWKKNSSSKKLDLIIHEKAVYKRCG
ncbi:23818_t:CDS:2 [Cetraspora pellucida]|uniref:23818_t:CDS:1 n=1 Tax=Cetraspora pellucida TaxID=1433469 RepID=A0A9N8WDZ0_9GLOM|nr:23818_t:CDS:2 [Cetraspora pellucida]